MKITLNNEQKLVLGQEMQMSMQVLQMNTQELEAYLQELATENPLLEIHAPAEHSPSFSHPVQAHAAQTDLPEASERLQSASLYESLKGALREQIAAARVPVLMRRELLYLVDEMDERGYLPQDAGDLRIFGGSLQRYEDAVTVLQSLEPAGVGARSLSECLCLQLRRLGVAETLPYQICEAYLEPLAKGQLNAIAKQLGVPKAKVIQAKSRIATLSPYPSNGFGGCQPTPYIVPDVEILSYEGALKVVPADRYMPTYGVDAFYAKMAERDDLTAEEQEYFRSKLAQAKWAINCVARRWDTLTACAAAILEQQYEFFIGITDQLTPVTMTELADRLDVSVSTVSRAVKGKYLACQRGTFPMSHFFAKEINGPDSGTKQDVLSGIKELIAAEDPAAPLSDRALAERLTERGFSVSRRTVAKYRENAAIPSAPGRKVWRQSD